MKYKVAFKAKVDTTLIKKGCLGHSAIYDYYAYNEYMNIYTASHSTWECILLEELPDDDNEVPLVIPKTEPVRFINRV